MESLKSLAWKAIEKEVFERRRRRKTWKEIREEMKMTDEELEEKENNEQEKPWKAIAEEVGWIDIVIGKWRIERKRRTWRHIHRDIVSTVR